MPAPAAEEPIRDGHTSPHLLAVLMERMEGMAAETARGG